MEILRSFEASNFVEILLWLQRWEWICKEKVSAGLGEKQVTAKLNTEVLPTFLKRCRIGCEAIELHEAVSRINRGLSLKLFCFGVPTWAAVGVEVEVLRELIQSELLKRRFCFIPISQVQELDDLECDDVHDRHGVRSWKSIWNRIPLSETDAREAVYCYALGRNTACIFHLMRVSEYGLRKIAKQLTVSIRQHKGKKDHPIEYADWSTVITAINVKLEVAQKLAKGKRRADTLSFYSDVVDHCQYLKDIWRNEVSHARKSYSGAEALGALLRVKSFMGLVSEGLKPRQNTKSLA